MKRDDLTLDDVGRLAREAKALQDETMAIDRALSLRQATRLPLDSAGTASVHVPCDIRELLVKLRKDWIKARIKEIEELVLPQKQ